MTKFPKDRRWKIASNHTQKNSHLLHHSTVAINSAATDHSTALHSLGEIARKGKARACEEKSRQVHNEMHFFVAFFILQVRTQSAV